MDTILLQIRKYNEVKKRFLHFRTSHILYNLEYKSSQCSDSFLIKNVSTRAQKTGWWNHWLVHFRALLVPVHIYEYIINQRMENILLQIGKYNEVKKRILHFITSHISYNLEYKRSKCWDSFLCGSYGLTAYP